MGKTRVASSAALKSKKMMRKESNSSVLLARGMSARYCGANTPLTALSEEEMERDFRHMEAFENACTAYAQQFYIFQNSTAIEADKKQQAPPIVAMPVRIDPEEEKRLQTLRQKIQTSEAQREILESEYLSLRAHYVYMSQRLKNSRTKVNRRVEFLQDMVQKRGQLVALQRARLQISREVLAALHYRQSGGKPVTDDTEGGNNTSTSDLVEVWNQIEDQFKKAEEACRSEGTEDWEATKVPKVPPGVPLLLSQLAKAPAFCAAWGTSGMFGSKPESMCWVQNEFPEPAHHVKSLASLRDEVDTLQRELDKETVANKELQSTIISRRKANVELVAMMSLLRTETEAVVARHNILLESDIAKEAALKLQEKEDEAIAGAPQENGTANNNNKDAGDNNAAVVDPSLEKADKRAEDNENDGDDEGGAGDDEEEEGEVLDSSSAEKRNLEDSGLDGSSPRSKRRK
eukprot:CAMPEP_0176142056 /NCGR_PEP_ID=MMETSP0120_2-20121206/72257_1 /TAXON_ID=160619 /ORGANISM="Kryptoperidinium foliaceum, Strain CCMP 1326" /LENGTH=460 /DNA_ID=CAMNT_0017478247 /DNA_START=67 /DNA_END=1446 /DNA_ORIENTATION=+